MKPDSERKKFHSEKLHQRKNRLHAHLSKDLRSKMKAKKRALLLHKGDTVKVMRGPEKGKEAKVSDVNVVRRKVFLEGIVVKNARGREVPVALEPSNLLILSLESTKERKELFSEEAFRKKEVKKPDGHKEEPKAEGAMAHEHKTHEAHKPVEHKPHEHKAEAKTEHKPAEHKHEAAKK